MRTSAGIVLLAGLTFAQGPACAEEPKPLTLRVLCARLDRAQQETPELSRRYLARKTVNGKVVKEGVLEIHRAGGVRALWFEGGADFGESMLCVGDAYGGLVARGGRIVAHLPGPIELDAIRRPLDLADGRVRRRLSLPPRPTRSAGWRFGLALKLSDDTVSIDVGLSFGSMDQGDLLPGIRWDEAKISPHPEDGRVRVATKTMTVDVGTRDGLLVRWAVHQPDLATETVLEAAPGGRSREEWAKAIREARALDASGAVDIPVERLIPLLRGSLPAGLFAGTLMGLADEVPAFWTDLDRLRKAIDELIPAYLEARRAVEDGIPYVVEPLIVDLIKPFETLAPEDAPRGGERAAVVALLARSLRELSAAGRRESGEGR